MIGILDLELVLKSPSLIMFLEIEHSTIVLVKRTKWHGVQPIHIRTCTVKET